MDAVNQRATIEQDADGVITDWDTAAEQLFGWSRADAVGRAAVIVLPERNAMRGRRHLAEILRGPQGRIYEGTITVRRRDGHEFPVRVAAHTRATSSGQRVVSLVRGIAPLQNDEQYAQRYLSILNQISDGCAVVDLRGNYLFVNDAFCRMFNYERDQLTGANFKSTIGDGRVNTLRAAFSQVYCTGRPAQ